MSISYDTVQQIEWQIEVTILKRFQSEGVVCPSQLCKGLFLVVALDNIDHNPSSTTTHSSFHGSGISIIQFPTVNNQGICREALELYTDSDSQKFVLPDSFAVVHAVSLNVTKADVPAARFEEISGSLNGALAEEDFWIKHMLPALAKAGLR